MALDDSEQELANIRELLRQASERIERLMVRHPDSTADQGATEDPFAFISAPCERMALRVTAEFPDKPVVAGRVAEIVRQRMPGYNTGAGDIQYYWLHARRHPKKRLLLPKWCRDRGHAPDV